MRQINIPFNSFLIAACSLLIASCHWHTGDHGDNAKNFDYKLQGTWRSNNYDNAVYRGTLKITYDRITINGYGEDQTQPPASENDGKRPFKGFTKETALKAYSQAGHIYIEDGGLLQEGIPYTYWDDYPPPDRKWKQFLRFTFGGREETLEMQKEQ